MDTHYYLDSMTIAQRGQLAELIIPVSCSSADGGEQVHLTVLYHPDLSQSLQEIQRLGLQRGIEILQGALDLLSQPQTNP